MRNLIKNTSKQGERFLGETLTIQISSNNRRPRAIEMQADREKDKQICEAQSILK